MQYISVYGTTYSADEPLYLSLEGGDFVWDRVNKRLLNLADLILKAEQCGHEWQPNEIGVPSAEWQKKNPNGMRYVAASQPEPEPEPEPGPEPEPDPDDS